MVSRGVSQHWIVIPGRHAREVASLAEWMGVSCER
jgi:hypothetical protein